MRAHRRVMWALRSCIRRMTLLLLLLILVLVVIVKFGIPTHRHRSVVRRGGGRGGEKGGVRQVSLGTTTARSDALSP